jgi:flagellar P-ring protein precursor FlgI
LFNLKRTLLKKIILLTLIFLLFPVMMEAAEYTEVEIGNITRLKGVRENQLIGYGIVVGLNGSGDSSRSQATVQSVANMLQNFGVNVDANQVSSGNIAAVMVTASLPPFVHSGDQIDIAVSSLGDADSLQGGTLLLTPLQAPNGEIYASAQGPVSIGGYNVSGGGNTQRQNHPTAGRIPGGAMVEKELAGKIDSNNLTYILENPNFETASQIAARINSNLNSSAAARAVDSATVNVSVPDNYSNRVVEFIAEINRFKVRPGLKARVVIDEKTGTVVFTHNVKISTVAVAHGNLSVKISTSTEVSQPPPFSGGETVETEETQIEVDEGEESNLVVVRQENAIEDLVTALNAIGATPRDIISIIQKIKAAGALHAELELR